MDVLRSCYSGTWNFPGVGRVRGYYFFAAPDTPSYEKWHWFGSRNWHKGDGTDWPEFGELETTRQTWRDGSFPFPQPPALQIGTDECIGGWLEPQAVLETPPFALIAGIDKRCFLDFNVNYLVGSGGGKKNGAADFSHHLNIVASGGARLDGSGLEIFGPTIVGSGGGHVDGSAAFSHRVNIVGSGGGRLDGAAGDTFGISIIGSGGARLDGAADVAHGLRIVAAGGGRLDGAGLDTHGATIVATGGARLDGSATMLSKPHILGSGGGRKNGHAIMSHTPGFLGSGGLKVSGRAPTPRKLWVTSAGWDGLCSLAPKFQGSLSVTVSSGTLTFSPFTSTTFSTIGAWETLWNSVAGTMTASLVVTTFTGGVNHQWKFQVQIIRADCTILYTSPYSAVQSGSGIATLTDGTWPGTTDTNNRIRLTLVVRSDSGAVSVTTSDGSLSQPSFVNLSG